MPSWPLLGCLLLTATLLGGCAGSDGKDGLDIATLDLAAPEVGAGHVVLALNVTLEDAGQARADDLIRVKTYDTSSGFLAHTDEVRLSKGLPATKPVEVRVELPRDGTFRMEVQVFHKDEVASSGRVDLRDLSRLQPTLHDTGLRIELDFQLSATDGQRTDVLASAYLTNEARSTSRPLTLQLKARDLRTGLVADQVWSPVGSVGPDETRQANGTLNVALGRDYDVEAVLWDGNIIVERGSGRVALGSILPSSPGSPSSGSASYSTTSSAYDLLYGQPTIDDSGDSDDQKSPGVGLALVAAVLVGVGVWLRRRAA